MIMRASDVASRGVVRLLGARPTEGRPDYSEAELRALVASSKALDGEERRIIDEVIGAGQSLVREVMVPRTEVVFLPAGLTVAEATIEARDAGYSRYPVMGQGADDVIGFVHLRDLLFCTTPELTMLRDLVREIRRLPAAKAVLPALSEMRREGQHLALVVDEYGGTAGIVALEDLIEELVGEIHDEYDDAPEAEVVGPPTEIDGLLNLADFAQRCGFALPDGPYETVGGFIMARLGRLAAAGDEVGVDLGPEDGHWRLTVLALDGRRVARVGLGRLIPAARPIPAEERAITVEALIDAATPVRVPA
jgi:putative hemolysin